MFEGEIMSYDGSHYHVYYKEDGDQERLTEQELEHVHFIIPNGSIVTVSDDSCSLSLLPLDDFSDDLQKDLLKYNWKKCD